MAERPSHWDIIAHALETAQRYALRDRDVTREYTLEQLYGARQALLALVASSPLELFDRQLARLRDMGQDAPARCGVTAPAPPPSAAPPEYAREAMEEAFRDWHGRHYNELEFGAGTGDVIQLFVELRTALEMRRQAITAPAPPPSSSPPE